MRRQPFIGHAPYFPTLVIDGPDDAPAIVLGNSLGTDIGLWDGQMGTLADRYRVVRFDYPGHGGQEDACIESVDALADGLLAALSEQGIERYAYCGLSLGGALGMALATGSGPRPRALVLSNTAACFGSPEFWRARMDQARREGVAALVSATVARWLTPEHAQSEPLLPAHLGTVLGRTSLAGYLACCQAVSRFDARASLERIDIPTLVIAGTRDAATPMEQARFLHQGIAGSRYAELPVAHLGNLGAPAAFNALLRTFLDQQFFSTPGHTANV